jgi:uncharacterized RDD family membrane protein YckC
MLVALFLPSALIDLATWVGAGAIGAPSGVSDADVFAAILGWMVVIYGAYVAWALILFTKGMTPGKSVLGLRVVGEDGDGARFWRMLFRDLVGKIISGVCLLLGYVWILVDKKKQGWHDRLASTFVVDQRYHAKSPNAQVRKPLVIGLGATAVIAAAAWLELRNGPPVVAVSQAPSLVANVGDTILGRPSRLFSDPDGDRLTYSVSSSDRAVARVSARRLVTVGTGTATLTVTATDPGGLSASIAIGVTVGFAVCDRPPGLRDEIVRATEATDCSAVTEEHLAGIHELEFSLDSDGEPLREGDFAGLSNLRSLGLRSELYEPLLPGAFAELSSLESLDLSGALTSLPEGTFAGLSSLESLVMRADRGMIEFSLPDFVGLSSLRSLDLSGNSLMSLPEGAFAELSSLETLDLSGQLWVVPAGPRSGEDLGLSSLSEGVFAGLSSLRSLNLSDNGLISLPEGVFTGLSSLESLDLSRQLWVGRTNLRLSSLSEGVFAGLSSLRSLGLSGNALTSLPGAVFTGLSSLERLDLSSNNLTSLPEGAFADLSGLESLRLAGNSLVSLRGGLLAGLSNLDSLSLANNSLTSLSEAVFAGLSSLESLEMGNNPGSPFALALGFELTDGTVPSSPVASVRLTLAEGAPFAMTVPLSVAGGTVLTSSASLAAGDVGGPAFKATRTSPGQAVRIAAGSLPEIPDGFHGIVLSAPDPLVLFDGADATASGALVNVAGSALPIDATSAKNHSAHAPADR